MARDRFKRDFDLKKAFSLDLRSMALFRVLLGALILLDLLIRSFNLRAHYTDFGVLPRDLVIANHLHSVQVCLHVITGTTWGQAILFAINAAFAFALLVGYRTRLMTFFCWLFLYSLQARNFMVLQGGDVLFRLMLFYGFFLPLGKRYSVDAALQESQATVSPGVEQNSSWLSTATVAYLLQILMIYLFTALLKMEDPDWTSGRGVLYALNATQLTTPLGDWLAQQVSFLKWINPFVLGFEFLGAFLILIPWRNGFFRLLAITLFLGMHWAFSAALKIGLFSCIATVAWSILLPSEFWDRVSPKKRPKLKFYYDRDCGVCRRMLAMVEQFLLLPVGLSQPAQSDPAMAAVMERENSWIVVDAQGTQHYRFDGILIALKSSILGRGPARVLGLGPIRWFGNHCYRSFANHRVQVNPWIPGWNSRNPNTGRSWIAQGFMILVIGYVLIWNLGTFEKKSLPLRLPSRWTNVGYALGIDQKWNMFARPIKDDGWYVIAGQLADGRETELLFTQDPRPVSWERPESPSSTFRSDRWRKYLLNLYADWGKPQRLYFGKWLCRSWNESHTDADELQTFEIFYMRHWINEDGTHAITPQRLSIWQHECFSGALARLKKNQ